MPTRSVTIVNKLGLHARAANLFAKTAMRFGSAIKVGFNGKMVDAKSVMSLMLLAANQGTVIDLHAEGDDENQALDALETLIADRFNEPE